MSRDSKLKVALIGNPNCGKSTLFNILTGLNQSTANFPGATVDKKMGSATLKNLTGGDVSVSFIDLPGIYSLNAKSVDEKIAVEILHDIKSEDHPDLVLYVADASNLKRSLLLASQIIDLKIPIIIALNMMDIVDKRGMKIDTKILSMHLKIPVLPICARASKGINELREEIASFSKDTFIVPTSPFVTQNSHAHDQTIERYRVITDILKDSIKVKMKRDEEVYTSRTDKIVTHKVWGYVIFLVVLFLIFESVFFIATYPMEWVESLFTYFSEWGNVHLPKGQFSDLLINGVFAGLSGIVVFIPQIALLFFFIAVLEDTGYMARVSFIMDKIMRKFGLNGRSVIPLLSGVACAVPAIMSTRTISNWKERLITILVTPLMSCSARLPVYTLLISLVVPDEKKWGFFNLQGAVLMFLYLLGFVAAMVCAFVLRFLIKSKERSYFIMELPLYRSPRLKNIVLTIIDRVKMFLFDAGKIIIAISIILWFMSSHAPGNKFQEIEANYTAEIKKLGKPDKELENKMQADKLESSYAGIAGKFIEPTIKPLGFDWKVGIALVTSFAAREVFVGTMATIYSAGDTDNSLSIREKMKREINPDTGKPRYTFAVGFSLMLFYAFAMQCMSTLAVVYRETRSWKWPMVQFTYMGILAYCMSFLAYHIFK